jgi:hypothetical protein
MLGPLGPGPAPRHGSGAGDRLLLTGATAPTALPPQWPALHRALSTPQHTGQGEDSSHGQLTTNTPK